MDKNKTKYIFFYLTLIYLFAFLFWWTYLLYQKTNMHYEDALKYQILKHTNNNHPLGGYLNSEAYDKQLRKFEREKIMIVTEGIVFSVFLFFLVYKVKKSVENEIEMSKQQQNFILSITHELKSPLSSIKLMSQTLAKHNLNEKQKNKLVNNTLVEVERLQNLVENVLLAAKIDSNKYGFKKTEINLSSLVNRLILSIKTAQNSDIISDIEKDIFFMADLAGMTSIIVNLLENAIKYSGEKSVVFIKLAKNNNHLILEVTDEGIGILDEEKDKIFDKFYRIGNEDTRATKGTGLGLYIVQKLVVFHNGKIQVKNNRPKGSIFKLIFEL